MLRMRVVTVVRGSLAVLTLVAAACSGPLQPQGTGSGGNGGAAGDAGTTGTAGMTGTGGAAGIAGAGGMTGTGGTTGTGGSDNTDGGLPPYDAGAPACTQTFQAPESPWTMGFQPLPDPPGTFQAVVSEVAADHLTLRRDGGESVTFRWAGPSIAAEFSVAESVSCETTAARWHIVKGARRTAEIQIGNSSTQIPQSGAFPAGGTFTLEPECASATASSCVGAETPIVHTFYRVVASLGGDSVAIPPQASATLGPLQITNVFNDGSHGGSSGLCHIDFSNVGLISVLAPP